MGEWGGVGSDEAWSRGGDGGGVSGAAPGGAAGMYVICSVSSSGSEMSLWSEPSKSASVSLPELER